VCCWMPFKSNFKALFDKNNYDFCIFTSFLEAYIKNRGGTYRVIENCFHFIHLNCTFFEVYFNEAISSKLGGFWLWSSTVNSAFIENEHLIIFKETSVLG